MIVVSGGQTGVDRAALDSALELGLRCGGWCPAGRWAEDGAIPHRYPLRETPGSNPDQRTTWNVRDSDATLILTPGPLTGGTALTCRVAADLGRPVLIATTDGKEGERIRTWLESVRPDVLNVAGPRESESPGIYTAATVLLRAVLRSAP